MKGTGTQRYSYGKNPQALYLSILDLGGCSSWQAFDICQKQGIVMKTRKIMYGAAKNLAAMLALPATIALAYALAPPEPVYVPLTAPEECREIVYKAVDRDQERLVCLTSGGVTFRSRNVNSRNWKP